MLLENVPVYPRLFNPYVVIIISAAERCCWSNTWVQPHQCTKGGTDVMLVWMQSKLLTYLCGTISISSAMDLLLLSRNQAVANNQICQGYHLCVFHYNKQTLNSMQMFAYVHKQGGSSYDLWDLLYEVFGHLDIVQPIAVSFSTP